MTKDGLSINSAPLFGCVRWHIIWASDGKVDGGQAGMVDVGCAGDVDGG